MSEVLVIGTGEYTTGFVPTSEGSAADKKMGVVGLVLFDLRRRGVVGRIAFAGTDGTKFPRIRQHFAETIAAKYRDMDVRFDSFPADDAHDKEAYKLAIAAMPKGSFALIYTPDDTHYTIALAALEAGLHVMLTKPATQQLDQHLHLLRVAADRGVFLCVDMHKRHDPMYLDAIYRSRQLGPPSYFYSFMSQPKKQLLTFGKWAGSGSDISYYLNTHHVDLLSAMLDGRADPVWVTAMSSTGLARTAFALEADDIITITVQWQGPSAHIGPTQETSHSSEPAPFSAHSVHTASWIAPKSDVHSQQRFHYVGHLGEITVDQAHRGYTAASDAEGFCSCNPLYMRYSPSSAGHFDGQAGYGYTIIEAFLRLDDSKCIMLANRASVITTAIMEAGRRSLAEGGRPLKIIYDETPPGNPKGFS